MVWLCQHDMEKECTAQDIKTFCHKYYYYNHTKHPALVGNGSVKKKKKLITKPLLQVASSEATCRETISLNVLPEMSASLFEH